MAAPKNQAGGVAQPASMKTIGTRNARISTFTISLCRNFQSLEACGCKISNPWKFRAGDESEFFCEAANDVEIFCTVNVVEIVVVRAGNEDDCVITRKALANPL